MSHVQSFVSAAIAADLAWRAYPHTLEDRKIRGWPILWMFYLLIVTFVFSMNREILVFAAAMVAIFILVAIWGLRYLPVSSKSRDLFVLETQGLINQVVIRAQRNVELGQLIERPEPDREQLLALLERLGELKQRERVNQRDLHRFAKEIKAWTRPYLVLSY